MLKINNTSLRLISTSELNQFNLLKPDIQRIVDVYKVDDLIKFQLEFKKRTGYFNFTSSGPINIHRWNDKYFLIDGQHRIEALEKLLLEYKHDIQFHILIVEVDTVSELEFNYKMINMNTPIPDFTRFKNIDKNIPETVANYFHKTYPAMWSTKSRIIRPQMYFTYFQEALGYICDKANIKTVDHLQKIITEYNNMLGKQDKKTFKVSDNIYSKAEKTGFYLGLYLHKSDKFGYNWVKDIISKITGSKIVNTKIIIPKILKNNSWDKYIGENICVAPCICCRKNMINAKDFSIGYITSAMNGGSCTIDNLLPICKVCNISINNRNMEQYVKDVYPNNIDLFQKRVYNIKNLIDF